MAFAEILNYTGNAALAGLADSVIDLSPALKSLDALNDRRNAVADMEYRQRIADRNKMFDAVANLKIDFDTILEEDRPVLNKKLTEIEDIIMQPGFFDDAEKLREHRKKENEFRELNAYAKTNYKTITEETIAASKEEDPELRDKMLNHVKEQRKKLVANPYTMYEPYKKDLKIDFDALLPKGERKGKVVSSEGFEDKVVSYVDPESLVREYNAKRIDTDGNTFKNKMDKVTDQWVGENRSAEARVREMIAWNNKIIEANELITDPELKIKEIPTEFLNGFNQGAAPEFNEDFTKEDFQKAMIVGNRFNKTAPSSVYNKERAEGAKIISEIQENQAQAAKYKSDANSNRIRANAYAAAQRQAQNMNEQERTDVKKVIGTLVDKIKLRTLFTTTSTKDGKAVSNKQVGGSVFVKDLPEGYTNINGVVLNDKGQFVPGKLEPFMSANGNQPYYKVEYYDARTNEKIDLKNKVFDDNYNLTLKNLNLDSKVYSKDNYIKDLIKQGNLINAEFQGKNGTANVESIGQSFRFMNAKSQRGKGGENIVNESTND